jgi:hypothetical protein
VLEELIRVNMLCGYFGLCIQDYNIYIYYERGRLREKYEHASSVSLPFCMKPLNSQYLRSDLSLNIFKLDVQPKLVHYTTMGLNKIFKDKLGNTLYSL